MQSVKDTIVQKSSVLFAKCGYEHFSMRTLAKEVPLASSVLYHYFQDKDDLLKTMFHEVNRNLGLHRALLPAPDSATVMLRQRIIFQFDHAEEIVAVLKYFLAFRKKFPEFQGGFLPDKSTLHIEEVLEFGVASGEFVSDDIKKDAKIISHAINGFLLEYYPDVPKGKQQEELVESIYQFVMRGLK